ncbi:HTH domain-containing protein [Pseudorhodobacter sp. E13]|uniref:helix-turn-helix transcriptional regulator n=1 Tax=Pseudorhodobacter sp. E13 TaxID=2487931 RepID=UPI000F8EDB5D|nr:HTH domain-containing protein [Pseudorhodobacter sp. E13]RUS59192.1 HTH domain-containing protein [Pseudorhodobacter sp. E13]
MSRDQRIFDLIQRMRDGRLHTAQELAAELGVSTRTIWRDMAMMAATGIPVEGERGLGYILRAPLMLPPVMLTQDELEALMAGLGHVAAGDGARARAARALRFKVATLLPQAGLVPDPQDLA